MEKTSTPTKQRGMEINVTSLVKGGGKVNTMIFKSPSDTTLYTPALQKKYIADKMPNERNMQSMPRQQLLIDNANKSTTIVAQDNALPIADDMMINQISDFVESIRMEGQQQRSKVTVPGHKEVRERTDKAILDAEKFKAQVADPPGKSFNSVNVNDMFEQMMGDRTMKQSQSGRSDDDFYYLTCHIDNNLVAKIERGDYVELGKLLPRAKNKISSSNDNRLEWVYEDGGTYLVPASGKNNSIS